MIYITITTVPDRLLLEDSIRRNLNSLLNQDTGEIYKVVVSIPHTYKNYETVIIPDWFTTLLEENPDKLMVLRGNRDYGPITNLMFPLQQIEMNPTDLLIVCDDDHEYEPSLITYHLKMLEKYPHKHAICFRGNGIKELRAWTENGKKMAKFWNSTVYFPTDRDIYVQLPDHWHSVSYQRKFFKDDFFEEDFLNISWNNDHLMGYYANTHDFYFLCAHVPEQTDTRPVNYDGRDSSSYPIKKQLGFELGGCYYYRQNNSEVSIFDRNLISDKGIFEWDIIFKE